MNKKITEYIVVASENLGELTAAVNRRIKEGYEPFQALQWHSDCVVPWTQVMVKTVDVGLRDF
jgi:hypothetical protein